MIPKNLDAIHHSFEIQAPNFNSTSVNFTKKEYLDYTLASVSPSKTDTLLEVAAGTCVCGRTFAPSVQTVVCLDTTAPMLAIGKEDAQKEHLNNMVFVKGLAEELPFLDASFDIVLSRLAFHHFTNIHTAFKEMVRVLKPGGKLVMIDMEAAEESLRETEDHIETLRDPSHVRNLSIQEMQSLFLENHLDIEKCEITRLPVHLLDWMALTKTPEPVQQQIIALMEADLNGQEKTGFEPYREGDLICFHHRWVLTLGRKLQ